MPNTSSKAPSISTALRNLLAAWPAGEVRHTKGQLVRRDQTTLAAVTSFHLQRRLHFVGAVHGRPVRCTVGPALAAGYLELEHTQHRRKLDGSIEYSRLEVALRRTDKPCRPHQPRRATGAVPPTFPWTADEHWAVLQQHPFFIPQSVAQRLTNGGPELEGRVRYPRLIATVTALGNERTAVAQAFGLTGLRVPGRRTLLPINRNHAYYHLPAACLTTPSAVRFYCLALLVEPVVEASTGRVTHFRAIDGQAAAAEMRALTANTGDLLARYLQHPTAP